MSRDSFREYLAEMVDHLSRYMDRADVWRNLERMGISRNHFYNVTNPGRKTSKGKPYFVPLEWLITLTNESKNTMR